VATLTYITVTGTYLRPDGITPKIGYVEFRPTVPLSVSGTGVIVSEPLRAQLDINGHFEIELLSTGAIDNPDLSPTGWLWFVDEKIQNGNIWYLGCDSSGPDPFDISYGFYPPGAAVSPPAVIEPGPAGIKGDKGDRGSLWYAGDIDPVDGSYRPQDMYLNAVNGDVWWYAGTGVEDEYPYGFYPYGSGPYGGS